MTADTGSENRIADLEARVDGLIEELVETKERVRLLEAELEPATQSGPREPEFGATKPTETESTDEKTTESDDEDEIIVA